MKTGTLAFFDQLPQEEWRVGEVSLLPTLPLFKALSVKQKPNIPHRKLDTCGS